MAEAGTTHLDELQRKQLDEMFIVVDEHDRVLGCETKRNCHLKENMERGLRHRSFSVVLFNMEDQLLIQQRSDAKYMFPGYFSDSCSGHPLYNPEELEEKEAIGIKRAALRRLQAELGIPKEQISIKDIRFMTRGYYKFRSDSIWGEQEVGYILLVRKNVTVNPDSREVKSYRYVSRQELEELLDRAAQGKEKVTPWFIAITEFLFKWWESLADVSPFMEPDKIHGLVQ
ncbi:isopentenyl-diphosphate delta-isomerase 2-like [Perognathus longimembris pacificus]|uniref:isopentenyl-diphosphate delta-isomerase 2-like n=1 Tax=Perognathus longimembris pacificus TaxID=214514 RepID=UPI002019A5F3|nr:isopentenyl-diphosphate delta-isomerase 2-like [Perognathus longimembris pacificus]